MFKSALKGSSKVVAQRPAERIRKMFRMRILNRLCVKNKPACAFEKVVKWIRVQQNALQHIASCTGLT
jgi:hypothetical protein